MAHWTESIVHESIIAPAEWRHDFSLDRGAVFGLASGLDQLSLLRPGPRHPRVGGLFFAGASARPGNGVPLVMVGARLCSDAVVRDLAPGQR